MKWPGLPRGLRIVLQILGFAYACVLALLYSVQSSLIFPGSVRQAGAEEFRPPEGSELVRVRARSGEEIVLLYGPALQADGSRDPEAAHRPTLIYFYGNGSSLPDSLWEFDHFRRLGANVLIPEYPGYGLGTGKASEAGCYAAAATAYEWLETRPATEPRRIVAAGFSLGGAVAIDLAARRPLAGLVTFSTFSSMVDMAAPRYPWVPVPLLLSHRFESVAKLARVRCPYLLAHGTSDEIVPAVMANRLAKAARGPVTRLDVAGAGHNDFFSVGGDAVLNALRDFLRQFSS